MRRQILFMLLFVLSSLYPTVSRSQTEQKDSQYSQFLVLIPDVDPRTVEMTYTSRLYFGTRTYFPFLTINGKSALTSPKKIPVEWTQLEALKKHFNSILDAAKEMNRKVSVGLLDNLPAVMVAKEETNSEILSNLEFRVKKLEGMGQLEKLPK